MGSKFKKSVAGVTLIATSVTAVGLMSDQAAVEAVGAVPPAPPAAAVLVEYEALGVPSGMTPRSGVPSIGEQRIAAVYAVPAIVWTVVWFALRYGPVAITWFSKNLERNIYASNAAAEQLRQRGWTCPTYLFGYGSLLRCRPPARPGGGGGGGGW